MISGLKVCQNMIISQKNSIFSIRAAILDAILNFSNCSMVTRCHPPDSLCRRPHLSKYVKTFSMYFKSRSTSNSPDGYRTKPNNGQNSVVSIISVIFELPILSFYLDFRGAFLTRNKSKFYLYLSHLKRPPIFVFTIFHWV